MTFSGIQWHLVTLGDNAQETEVLLEYTFCARFHVFQIYLTHLFLPHGENVEMTLESNDIH